MSRAFVGIDRTEGREAYLHQPGRLGSCKPIARKRARRSTSQTDKLPLHGALCSLGTALKATASSPLSLERKRDFATRPRSQEALPRCSLGVALKATASSAARSRYGTQSYRFLPRSGSGLHSPLPRLKPMSWAYEVNERTNGSEARIQPSGTTGSSSMRRSSWASEDVRPYQREGASLSTKWDYWVKWHACCYCLRRKAAPRPAAISSGVMAPSLLVSSAAKTA
jgi:hypothetical protein